MNERKDCETETGSDQYEQFHAFYHMKPKPVFKCSSIQ